MKIRDFQKTVRRYYEEQGRHDLPWRQERSPFTAWLSEVMLQQTQVPRVIEKFGLFRRHYSCFAEIAAAPQGDIIALWQGLGYNRRALFVHRAAQKITTDFQGHLPEDREDLLSLPGIGPATAASLQVYAFNQPVAFIETNIRAVFIYHFFNDKNDVADADILPLVQESLDTEDPYHWYSALMDYGTMIKEQHKNPARRSAHHVVQSTFEGSRRQVRGAVLRALSLGGCRVDELREEITDERFDSVLADLCREGFVDIAGNVVCLR